MNSFWWFFIGLAAGLVVGGFAMYFIAGALVMRKINSTFKTFFN